MNKFPLNLSNPPTNLKESFTSSNIPLLPQNLTFLSKLLNFSYDFFRFSDEISTIPIILTFIFNIMFYESLLLILYETTLSYKDYALCISFFLALKFVLSLFFSIDFLIKMLNFRDFEILSCYNYFFFLIDFISGPLAFSLSMKNIIFFGMLEFYVEFCILSIRIISYRPIREMLAKIYQILPLITPFLLYLFIFSYIFSSLGIILFSDSYPEDWGNYPLAFFSIFQLLTLDNWGRAGLKMENSQGNWKGMIIIAFNFFFNFCFLNYFVGCMVDYLSFSDKILKQIAEINEGSKEKISSFFKNCLFGSYYKYWIESMVFVILLKDICSESDLIGLEINLIIILCIIFIYTAHFILFFLGFLKEFQSFNKENNHLLQIQIFLNFVSGPLALLAFFFFYTDNFSIEYLNSFILLKTFTITPLKFILFDNIRVISLLFSFYLFIFVIVFLIGVLLCGYLSITVPDLFGSMNKGFFTVMEIITLDGWASSILAEIEDYMDFAAILEIFLVISIHFVLINIVNALACNEMNLIYMRRTGVKLTRYNKEIDEKKVIVIKKACQDIIEISLRIGSYRERFSRKSAKTKQEKLLGFLDKKLILEDPEEIQSFILLKKAITESKKSNIYHFSLIESKFIHKDLKIRTLAGIKRKRTAIFEEKDYNRFHGIRKIKSDLGESCESKMKHVQNLNDFSLMEGFDGIEEECVLIFRGKRVKINYLYFLRLNNNVGIESREEDWELTSRIKERASF